MKPIIVGSIFVTIRAFQSFCLKTLLLIRYIVNKTSVASVQLGKPLDLKLSFVSPPRQGIGLKRCWWGDKNCHNF